MIRYLACILLIALFSLPLSSQTIQEKDSKVVFYVSNFGFKKVDGSFSGMKGNIKFYSDSLSSSSFNVCIEASTINTGNKKRDEHLMNEDFFYVELYPSICFVSSRIERSEAGYKATGALTMHGVSKEIELPFSFKNNEFIGEIKLDRKQYQIGESVGSFMVGNEVNIKINCIVD